MRDYFNLPFIVLLAYSILCFFRVPELSDSFIVIALAGLYGYKLYLNHLTPELPKLNAEQRQLREQMDTFEMKKRVDALKYDINKLNSAYIHQEEAKKRSKVVF